MLSVHSSPIAQLGGKEAGGMNVYVRELSRELGRRGIGVDIFTRSQDTKAPTTVAIDRGVRVINLHTGPSAPYDKNWVLDYVPEFVSRVRCFADGLDFEPDKASMDEDQLKFCKFGNDRAICMEAFRKIHGAQARVFLVNYCGKDHIAV